MLKINKISIENFRGIKSPVIIDFIKGGRPTSALIYGRNGTGKSSIVDAWEWLINSKISNTYRRKVFLKETILISLVMGIMYISISTLVIHLFLLLKQFLIK